MTRSKRRYAAATLSLLLTTVSIGACSKKSDPPAVDEAARRAGIEDAARDKPDDTKFQFGQSVIIEDGRVIPARLGAPQAADVEFVNRTSGPVTLHFTSALDDQGVHDTGEIPAGASLRFNTPYLGTFAFSVKPGEVRGVVEVTSTDPGQ